MVKRVDGVFFKIHHFEAALLRRLFELLAKRKGIEIVASEDGHTFRIRRLCLDDIGHRLAKRVVGGERSEKILVTLIVDLARRGCRR